MGAKKTTDLAKTIMKLQKLEDGFPQTSKEYQRARNKYNKQFYEMADIRKRIRHLEKETGIT